MRRPRERARLIELLEEDPHLGRDRLGNLLPRARPDHPARAALDAVDDEQRQAARREALPVCSARRSRPRGCAV